jgi:hypothetical protein
MQAHRTRILAVAVVLSAMAVMAATAASAQNRFVNADLDEAPDSWQLACGIELTWSAVEDEAGCPASGSVHATSGPCIGGLQGAGAGQCVPVTAGETIHASGRIRAAHGFVGVAIRYHDTADCTGTPVGEVTSAPQGATGDWQTVSHAEVVPAGIAAAIGFGAVDATPVDADVDTGYAGDVPQLFRDGFQGDGEAAPGGCRWSSVAP